MSFESQKFSQWFKEIPQPIRTTRTVKPLVQEVPTRTVRYEKTAIPQMAKLINKNKEEIMRRRNQKV